MYTDLSDTRLYLQCKVVQTDGTNLPAGHDVGPVNMLFHALFRSVDVELNGRQITQSTNLYPFKAGFETLLNFNKATKESQLHCALGYVKDRMEIRGGQEQNVGFADRKTLIQDSRTFELMGPLHVDLFFQEKYLLDNVPMRIKLIRSQPSFYLQSQLNDPGAMLLINPRNSIHSTDSGSTSHSPGSH